MNFYVKPGHIVRRIWSRSDTILFVFAGAAAEFALNKAVDWLYFTGRLPKDPLGRLFSTVRYARAIVFAPYDDALKAIHTITSIHKGVENKRGSSIPHWAYRDVLYMLIYYSIASYELLNRKLSVAEKEDLYEVFYRMGRDLGLKELPPTYAEWLPSRQQHLDADLARTNYTDDLFLQYEKHLGTVRYRILRQAQKLVLPLQVSNMLGMGGVNWLRPAVPAYKMARFAGVDPLIRRLLLPADYLDQINALDVDPDSST